MASGLTGESQISISEYYQTPGNRQPETNNPLMNTYFKFTMDKAPTMTYFCQKVNLPSLSLDGIEQPTPFGGRLYKASDAYTYDDLTIDFIVDENMKNWLELYNWLRSCADLKDYTEFEDIDIHMTNAELLITNSAKQPIKSVHFSHVIPTSVGSIQFDSSTTDTEPIISTASFKFAFYDITSI